jgi:hypothetical protein
VMSALEFAGSMLGIGGESAEAEGGIGALKSVAKAAGEGGQQQPKPTVEQLVGGGAPTPQGNGGGTDTPAPAPPRAVEQNGQAALVRISNQKERGAV